MLQNPKEVGAKGESPFIKIEPNETIRLLILATDKTDWVFFKKDFESMKTYPATEVVPGDNVKWRFRVNVVPAEAGKEPQAKIFEHGAMVYEQLFDLSKEYDLSQTVIAITRTGSGLRTTYKIMPAAKQPSAEMLTRLRNLQKREIHPDKDKEYESDGTITPNEQASEDPPPPTEQFAPTSENFDEIPF